MTASPANQGATKATSRTRLGWLGLAIGGALLVAAIIAVISQRESLSDALDALAHPPPILIAALFGCVCLNMLLTGGMFSVLMSKYGRVGVIEMQALIAASSLLNYLPARPGLFARVAYHKIVNDISVRHSTSVVLQALAITLLIAAMLGVILLACAQLDVPLVAGVIAPPLALLAMVGHQRWRVGALAALVRYLEVFVWAARYHICFHLLGSPISLETSLALACVSMFVSLVPFLSNGLGLREWAVGGASNLLVGFTTMLGVTADLVNRAAELVIVLLAGLIAIAHLTRRARRAKVATAATTDRLGDDESTEFE